MDLLDDLRIRLSHTGTNIGSMSVVEAYNGFIKSSEHGRNCQYALKSLALFYHQDFSDIKVLLEQLTSCLSELQERMDPDDDLPSKE